MKSSIIVGWQYEVLVMGEGYSWVPPGLTSSRVEEYMRQLPGDKVSDDNGICAFLINILGPKKDMETKALLQ